MATDDTRFGSKVIVLERLHNMKEDLEDTVKDEVWREWAEIPKQR